MKNELTSAPHIAAGNQNGEHNAALLIDFDNVTMGIRSNLGQELRKLLDSEIIRGKVAVQRNARHRAERSESAPAHRGRGNT